ncbi:MAG: peptidoglycan-binding protein [Myxococcales bacterium]|jgi:murein L,D-transpeptidase YcbB/YkuD|nr:peptidoglycan-binding protein [Myxococcales bacterium]MBL0195838.1 peptidoglycan-binding protein [Myxococcales bacterium]HQY60127.1 peptidoglycan-binding protein [Polyangiaceae bacterium]
MAMLRRGLSGEPVRILQERLGLTADGIFGPNTEAAVREFQSNNGLQVDGVAGPDTFMALELPQLVILHKPLRGEQVRRLQEALGVDADGKFGPGTEAAVKQFQEQNGLEADGFAGPQTLALLPGFAIEPEQVEASLITEETPEIPEEVIEQAKAEEPPPPEPSGFVSTLAAVAFPLPTIGKTIWSTVKKIF